MQVLLSRIQRSGIEQEQDFFLADRLEKKEKQKKQFHGTLLHDTLLSSFCIFPLPITSDLDPLFLL
jgi:hypothetical protein